MKLLRNILFCGLLLFSCSVVSGAEGENLKAIQSEDMGKGLRQLFLKTTAAEAGIKPGEEFPKVFGAMLDWPMDGQVLSVISMSDGSASIYSTTTYGVIGGDAHESVRKAAMELVKVANEHFDTAKPVKEFPYPAPDIVRFYFLGFDGVRMLEADAATFEKDDAKLIKLWSAAQRVMTELRKVGEKAEGEN